MNNLSEKIILKLSNPATFEQGKKYYLQGRVTEYNETNSFLEAIVIGTDLYRVKISKADLTAECNCKDFNRKEFCKHQVAVMLTSLSGEIIPRNKPLIKGKESEANNTRDIQFQSSLQNIPRDNLIKDVTELGRTNPDIEEYFIQKYSEKSIEYYKELELKIRKKINSILNFNGKNDYPGKVFTASREVNSLIQNLPPSRHTSDFLLSSGKWISDQLRVIEDPSGFLSDLIQEMLEISCKYLNNAKTDDLILFYQYTSLKTDFDFNLEIIRAILNKVTNSKIIEAIITKLEKSIYKKDPDFGFEPESGWNIMMKYLSYNNIIKYEELIPELINRDSNIKFVYINFLYEMGRYEEVIKFRNDIQYHPITENIFEKSILALDNKEQICAYYIDQLKKHFDLDTLIRFSEIEGIKEMPEWIEIITNILSDKKYIFYHGDILLFLKRYDEFIDFISNKGEEYHRNNAVIEKQAARFMVTDPPMAIKLYHYLIKNEIERIKRSNRYFALIEYLENLKILNDLEYIEGLKNRLIRENPTKLKLIQVLNEFHI